MDTFWQELEALTYAEGGEMAYFFKTGRIPSEINPTEPLRDVITSQPHHDVPPKLKVGAESIRASSSNQESQGDPYHSEAINLDRTTIRSAPPTVRTLPQAAHAARHLPIPTPLLSTERLDILHRIASDLESWKEPGRFPLIHPYSGKRLTPGLTKEAFGYKTTLIRKHGSGFFLTPGWSGKSERDFVLEDGGMETRRTKSFRAFVWQRYPIGETASIFRLIGLIETPFRAESRLRNLPAYETGRKDLEPLGTDSIVDHSVFLPRVPKA